MDKILGKVPMGEKIGYSLGDAAANLVFQMMMIYQLKFYTDVFGLEGAIAGTVLLIARIVDAFVDRLPASCRTKHKRSGGSSGLGSFGQLSRSWSFMCWLSTIRGLKIRRWSQCMPVFHTCCLCLFILLIIRLTVRWVV